MGLTRQRGLSLGVCSAEMEPVGRTPYKRTPRGRSARRTSSASNSLLSKNLRFVYGKVYWSAWSLYELNVSSER